ncbi:MAG: hypothetical protein IJ086_00795 [Clostridium sp.]|nr:hypothetical protein [Clostridium sp.]
MSSTEHTGYQIIFMEIITTIIIGIILFNIKIIGNLLLNFFIYIYNKFIKSILEIIIYKVKLLIFPKKLTRKEIEILIEKNKSNSEQIKKYEIRALKKYLKYKCLIEKLSIKETEYLIYKRNNNMDLEIYELEFLEKMDIKLKELSTSVKLEMKNLNMNFNYYIEEFKKYY